MPSGPRKGHRFDIGDIVRVHRAELDATVVLSREQRRVLTDIAQCRTAALGGHLDRCDGCGFEHPSYNSCRNRHCPKCQALAQEKWIAEQRLRMLDGRYFHVVFTLPSELRALAAFAPRTVYNALLHVAGRLLLEFGRRRLKAEVGATLVLHTWTRALAFHPHAHAIVQPSPPKTYQARLLELTGRDVTRCVVCSGFLNPIALPRGPPLGGA